MTLDPDGLRAASEAFGKILTDEAQAQRAYVRRLPDGRMSLELEWLDLNLITQAIITAYFCETV
jgi:hypothetical protein